MYPGLEYPRCLKEMTAEAIVLHQNERRISLQSVQLIGELDSRKAWRFLDMSIEKYAKHIGLTPSKFFKRIQAARVINRFEKAVEIYEKGETEISHLAMIAGRITDANSDVLIEGIRGKTKREVEAFISRVGNDGSVLQREGVVEMTLRLTESEKALFDRAREVLAHGGHVPGNAEILLEATRDLLAKRDPVQKAKRATLKRLKAEGPKGEVLDLVDDLEIELERLDVAPDVYQKRRRSLRTYIPQAVRNAVQLRDKAQCTHVDADGDRCPEKMMLEIDHVQMVCRGGTNAVENLRLLCRSHNTGAAWKELGQAFMERKVRGGD